MNIRNVIQPRARAIFLAHVCLALSNRLAGVEAAGDEPPWEVVAITPRRIDAACLEVRLSPDAFERRPGNAALILLKLPHDRATVHIAGIHNAYQLLDLPDAEFSPAKAREAIPLFQSDLALMRRAALCETADWAYPLHEPGLANVLLPDAQYMYKYVSALAVLCRADIVEGKTDDALDKIRIGISISEHLGRTPLLVTKNMQRSLTARFLERTREFVQLPDAPNTYWGLAALPEPLVDLRPTIGLERKMLADMMPPPDASDGSIEPSNWALACERLMDSLGIDRAPRGPGIANDRRFEILKVARAELGALAPELSDRVEQMSNDEVFVRYFASIDLKYHDRMISAMLVRPESSHAYLRKLAQERAAVLRSCPEVEFVFGALQFAIQTWSLKRRVTALQTVEALRDYAAAHDGQFPATLDQIDAVPIPVDPFTGKPLQYSLEQNAALLSTEPIEPFGDDIKVDDIRYRIQFRQ